MGPNCPDQADPRLPAIVERDRPGTGGRPERSDGIGVDRRPEKGAAGWKLERQIEPVPATVS